MNKDHTFIIPHTAFGQRIDVIVAGNLPQYSRSQLSNWIKLGYITVNQKRVKPKDKMLGGEMIDVKLPDLIDNNHSIDPWSFNLSIVFEDEDVLVIDKPSDLVVHPGAGNYEKTLAHALIHHAPKLREIPRAGIVHRLDKNTTGLMVVAKTLPAHLSLVNQLKERSVKRHYQALVYGPLTQNGMIHTFMGRHPKNRLKMAVLSDGKEAITHYTVKKLWRFFTLMDVSLNTGRTHQIRVHMSHLKHPIVGDDLYSGNLKFPPKVTETLSQVLKDFKRQALHAYRLSFIHPKSQKSVDFKADLPYDFQLLINEIIAYEALYQS